MVMAFPPGTIAPVAGTVAARWPDGWTTMRFNKRTELYDCMVVACLCSKLGLSVQGIQREDGVTRVTIA